MSIDLDLQNVISQLKAGLETNYLVKKHSVTDNTDSNDSPQLRVKISLADILNSTTDLTNLVRDIRRKTPNAYSIKLEIKSVF